MTVPSNKTDPPSVKPHPFWLIPVGALVGCLLFLTGEDGPLAQQAFIGAMWGAFGAVPVVMVSAFILITLNHRRESAEWDSHSLSWYLSTHPECAVARSEVHCHSCGEARVHRRNMNSRGDVRAVVCSECGEVLYYERDD